MAQYHTSRLFRSTEVAAIERQFPDGLASHQLVELFRRKGERFSEATLRKYVQLGLLPRSRRVGLKGKHRGSQGLYPVETVRRIAQIKEQMAEGLTIEDVRDAFAQAIDLGQLREALRGVLERLERRLTATGRAAARGTGIEREFAEARRSAGELLRHIERLDRQVRPVVRRPLVAVPAAPPRS